MLQVSEDWLEPEHDVRMADFTEVLEYKARELTPQPSSIGSPGELNLGEAAMLEVSRVYSDLAQMADESSSWNDFIDSAENYCTFQQDDTSSLVGRIREYGEKLDTPSEDQVKSAVASAVSDYDRLVEVEQSLT